MGKPKWGDAHLPYTGIHTGTGITGGTETSKYSEEKKSTEIALVAASESASAQTQMCVKAARRCHLGVAGMHFAGARTSARSYKTWL